MRKAASFRVLRQSSLGSFNFVDMQSESFGMEWLVGKKMKWSIT
jgi:hypothetical protein